jgi:hypothetical protein
VSFRDPVKRAFSQFIHDKRLGLIENKMTFEEALKYNNTYVENSMYFKHTNRFIKAGGFKRENILFLLSEDMKKDPMKVFKQVYEFLGVKDKDFIPNKINKKSNSAGKAIIPKINEFMIKTEYRMREKEPEKILKLTDKFSIRDIAIFLRDLNRINYSKRNYPKINTETEEKLRKVFQEDIRNLEKLTGFNLENWY